MCAYCGSRFEVAKVRSAKTVHGVSVDLGQLAREAGPAGNGAAVTIAIVGVMLVLVLGGTVVAVLLAVRSATTQSFERVTTIPSVEPPKRPAEPASAPPAEPPAEPAEPADPPEQLWISSPFQEAPTFFSAPDAALVVARVRKRPGDTLIVEAYRVADGERAWRFEPGATYGEGSSSVGYTIEGDRVLVSDHQAQVHVLDVRSGEGQSTVGLSDHFDRFCRVDDVLFVVAKDRQAWQYEAGRLVSAQTLPRNCGRGGPPPLPDFAHERGRQVRSPEARSFEGSDTRWTRAFAHGSATALFGERSPGTRVPRVGRLEPGGTNTAWVVDVPDGSLLEVGDDMSVAVSDGRHVYVAHARADRSWRLTAIDANDGARRWTIPIMLEGSVINLEALAVLDGTVVVAGDRRLDAYDATSGSTRWSMGER